MNTVLRRALLVSAIVAPFNVWVFVPAGTLSIRPLQVWLAGYLALVVMIERRELARLLNTTTLLFGSFLLTILVSTAFATPALYVTRGVLDVTLLSLNLAAFAVVHGALIERPAVASQFLRWLATSATVSGAALTARALIETRGHLQVEGDTWAFGIGTVIGTFEAAFAAAATVALVFAPTWRFAALAAGLLVTAGAATLLSLARGPWLGYGVTVVTVLALGAWQFRSGRLRFLVPRLLSPVALLTVALGGVVAANAQAIALIGARLLAFGALQTGTAHYRSELWAAMIDDAWHSPVFGHGAASYRGISELMGIQGSISENFAVEILHAGGLLGVAFLTLGIASALGPSLRAGDDPYPEWTTVRLAAVAAAGTALIGSLTNPAAWDGLFWVMLAAAAAPLRTGVAEARSSGRRDVSGDQGLGQPDESLA
jgi:hypothetical protein